MLFSLEHVMLCKTVLRYWRESMSTRNDVIVAARVPEEIKEQGNAVLAELGATPTQLINDAYRYVLEFKRLPCGTNQPKPGKRSLNPKRLDVIIEQLSSMQVANYDYTLGGTRTLKEALAEERSAEYEAEL